MQYLPILLVTITTAIIATSVMWLVSDHHDGKESRKRFAVVKERVRRANNPNRVFTFSVKGDKFSVVARTEKEAWEKVRRITDGKGGHVMRVTRK